MPTANSELEGTRRLMLLFINSFPVIQKLNDDSVNVN